MLPNSNRIWQFILWIFFITRKWFSNRSCQVMFLVSTFHYNFIIILVNTKEMSHLNFHDVLIYPKTCKLNWSPKNLYIIFERENSNVYNIMYNCFCYFELCVCKVNLFEQFSNTVVWCQNNPSKTTKFFGTCLYVKWHVLITIFYLSNFL